MLFATCFTPLLALAQPAPAPIAANPDLSVEDNAVIAAAQDDALACLARAVDALPVADNLTIGRLFEDMPEESLALRRVLQKRAEPIAHRVYSDGSADVDLAIAVDYVGQAIEQIKKSSAGLQKKWPDVVTFNSLPDAPDNRLIATGIARPPARLLTLEGPASQPGRTDPAPATLPGWRHVSEADRALAAEAARAHALHRLFERIQSHPIDAGRTVRTFLLNNPGQLPRCRAALADEAAFKIDYDPAGVCVAHVDVPSRTARQWLPRTLAERVIPQDVLSASGLAEPPPALQMSNPPNWIDESLSAAATSRSDPAAPQADVARRAATALAKRRLAQKIDQLILPTGRSVRDAILARPHLAPDLKIYLSSARPIYNDADDGRSTVTLFIPLRRLYLLLTPAGIP